MPYCRKAMEGIIAQMRMKRRSIEQLSRNCGLPQCRDHRAKCLRNDNPNDHF
jgi:hypothetical protein